MNIQMDIKFIPLIIFFISALNAQIKNFQDIQNSTPHKNSIENVFKSLQTKEKVFNILNTPLKCNTLTEDKSPEYVQLDSLYIIELASNNNDEKKLDTTKQIFSYSLFGNSYSRTKKIRHGRIWNNVYRVTSTYDFNSRLSGDLSEKWENNCWEGNTRETYYYIDKNSYYFIEEKYKDGSWNNHRKITNIYNSLGSIILDQSEDWINGSWVNSYKRAVEYNQNNNMIKDTRENWIDGNYEGSFISTYTYNSFNKIATHLYEINQDGARIYADNHIYSYDDVGNIISCSLQRWRNNEWNNWLLYTYECYPDGKIKTCLSKFWDENNWINNNSESYVYDERGNEIEIIRKSWEKNILKKVTRESVIYNLKNQILTSLTESLINNIPQKLYRLEYQYNEYGSETYFIWENWVDNDWQGLYKRVSTYDKEGKLIDATAEKWNNGWVAGNDVFSYPDIEGYWRWGVDYYKLNAYYSKKGDPGNNYPAKAELYQNYPNPFNSITRIHFFLPGDTFVRLIVYDTLGQEVISLLNKDLSKGMHTVDFQSSSLASGVYFYRIITNNYDQTKKMLLVK